MAGTPFVVGPAYLGSSVADIYTPPASTIYRAIKHIHIANVTAGAVTFTLYRGLTGGSAGGTELYKAVSIAANSYFNDYFNLKMKSTDFLSGLASAGTSLVITITGEDTVVP